MKDKILKRLQEHWNYAVSLGYNEDRFLGIFAYGSMNYGFYSEKSDVDSKIIILPSFADLCLNKEWYSKDVYLDNGEHIEIKDIRSIRELFMKQNINYVQILYSKYFILNPKYGDLFNKYFINNRDSISHYDESRTVKCAGGHALNLLKNGEDMSNKDLYNAYRLYYFLRDYSNGKPYLDCLQPKGEEYDFLWKLKNNMTELLLSNGQIKSRRALSLSSLIKEKMDKYDHINIPKSIVAQHALDKGVIEILKYSFEDCQLKSSASKEEFYSKLTNAETRAYHSIIKEIGDEGNITISKLVKDNNISRPVYNNLIVKMKDSNIANVVNMGVKGTYIKIIETQLKAEAIDFK